MLYDMESLGVIAKDKALSSIFVTSDISPYAIRILQC